MDATAIENVIRFVLGCVVLLAGRNIFWLIIAVFGFLVGTEMAGAWLATEGVWLVVAAGIAAGVVGALLAVLIERLAFALVGFYAAAYLAVVLAGKLGLASAQIPVSILGGLVGAFLAALVTDWVIIVLTALAGASAIMSIFTVAPAAEALAVAVLASIGFIVQRATLARSEQD